MADKFSLVKLGGGRGGARSGSGRKKGGKNTTSGQRTLGFSPVTKPADPAASVGKTISPAGDPKADSMRLMFREEMVRIMGPALLISAEETRQLREEVLGKLHAELKEVRAERAEFARQYTPRPQPAREVAKHMATTSEGFSFCAICTRHSTHFRHSTQQNSPWILDNGGQKNPKSRAVNKHFYDQKPGNTERGCDMHVLAINLEKQRRTQPIPTAAKMMQAEAKNELKKLFRCLLYIVQRDHSFREFEHLVDLHFMNGATMGDSGHSRMTAAAMTTVLYDMLIDDAKHFFTGRCDFTEQKRHVGVAADKMSDPLGQDKQYEI
jgi:hypothetical protein